MSRAPNNESHHKTDKAMRTLLAYDETDDPAPPLNDLARRKWINQIIDAAESPLESETDYSGDKAASWRWGFALGAVTAAAMLAFLVWQWPLPPTSPPATASSPPDTKSQLAMVSGQVTANRKTASTDRVLRAEDRIKTGRGAAVAVLRGGVLFYLDEHSDVVLSHPNAIPPEIHLHKGRIVAAVDETRQGDLAFTVTTSQGKITVTGTVFSVTSKHAQVDVQVLKGRVRVSTPGLEEKVVVGRQGLLLPKSVPRTLTNNEVLNLRRGAEPLQLFNVEQPAQLSITSDPARARVRLDGVSLGRTPLSVSVRPGVHQIEVSSEGYRVEKRTTELESGKIAVHEVALSKIAPPAIAKEVLTNQLTVAPMHPVRHRTKHEKQNPPITAAGYFERVRRFREVGDWNGAANVYRQVLERYPNTKEASIAQTGCADLYLTHLNRAEEAVVLFEDYLTKFPRGTLAQEAAYGRIRALRRVGRTSEEIVALEAFVENYPKAIQSESASNRLDELKMELD